MITNQVISNNTINNYKSDFKSKNCSETVKNSDFANVMNKTTKEKVDNNCNKDEEVKSELFVSNKKNKVDGIDKQKTEEALNNIEIIQPLINNFYNNSEVIDVDTNENVVFNSISDLLNQNIDLSNKDSVNNNESNITEMLKELDVSNINEIINNKQFSKELIVNLQQIQQQFLNNELLDSNSINQDQSQLATIINSLLSNNKNIIATKDGSKLENLIDVEKNININNNNVNVDKINLNNNTDTSELENVIKNSILGKNIVTVQNSEKNISDMVIVEENLDNKSIIDDGLTNNKQQKEKINNIETEDIKLSSQNKVVDTVNSEIKISDSSDKITRNVISQVKNKIVFMSKQGLNTVKMQLHPEDLGELDIKLLFEKGKLSVEILASNSKTQSLLASNLGELKDILKDSINENTMLNIEVKEDTPKDYLHQNNQRNNRQQYENENQDSYDDSENDSDNGIDYVSFQNEINQLVDDAYN